MQDPHHLHGWYARVLLGFFLVLTPYLIGYSIVVRTNSGDGPSDFLAERRLQGLNSK